MIKSVLIGAAAGVGLGFFAKKMADRMEKTLDQQFCDLTGGKEKKQ